MLSTRSAAEKSRKTGAEFSKNQQKGTGMGYIPRGSRGNARCLWPRHGGKTEQQVQRTI